MINKTSHIPSIQQDISEINQNSSDSSSPKDKKVKQLPQIPTANTIENTNKFNSVQNLNSTKNLVSEIEINKNQEKEDDNPSLVYKIAFATFGLSSIVSWNVLLSSFAFFEEKFGFRVYNTYTIPIMVGKLVIGIFMPFIAPKVSLSFRVTYAMGALSVILIILPLLGFLLPSEGKGNSDLGYILTVILVFVQGSINSTAQNSMVALASQKGGKLCGIFWIGQGFSGLTMSILTCLCTVVFPPKVEGQGINPLSVIIFFSFAVLLTITTGIFSKIFISQENIEDEKEKKFNKEKVIQAIKIAGFIPVFICLIFTCTFTVFPGLMLANIQFDTNFLSKDSGLWGLQLLNLTFQIGDVVGRFIANYEIFHKIIPHYILTICRFIFVLTGALVAYDKGGSLLNNDWFPFVNMFLLSLTSGFNTTCLMAIAPKLAKGKIDLQETIGFVCTFMLIVGLTLGSFIAYPINPET